MVADIRGSIGGKIRWRIRKKEQAMVVSQSRSLMGIFSMWIHTEAAAERQTWTVYFYVYKGCNKVIASSDQYL